jgi:site-specific DNA-adenine methylase
MCPVKAGREKKMFGYLGAKGSIVQHYPEPQYGKVIEPFCGSARYALRFWDREVWINDCNPIVFSIWCYLQTATRKQIQALPDRFKVGDRLSKIRTLTQVERNLLGFCVQIGATHPQDVVSKWAIDRDGIGTVKRRILKHIDHIRDWKITCLDYRQIRTKEPATWFIDAPYQYARKEYRFNKLDYAHLADWCRTRQGQVIVCEGTRDGGLAPTWLPFRHLVTTKNRITSRAGTRVDVTYDELIWTQDQDQGRAQVRRQRHQEPKERHWAECLPEGAWLRRFLLLGKVG